MASTLDVINSCLASMGEAPLNSESEPHEYKASAKRLLLKSNRTVQTPGWWFNTEVVNLVPSPANQQIQLSNDTIQFRSGTRLRDTGVLNSPKPWIVQRGQRLYDTRTNSYTITENVSGELVREVPFEELPPSINDLIAALTVLKFQSDFDADSNKRAELGQDYKEARMRANSENIRQLSVNLLNSNERLQRIKRVSRRQVY
jgi:hypothetical protein